MHWPAHWQRHVPPCVREASSSLSTPPCAATEHAPPPAAPRQSTCFVGYPAKLLAHLRKHNRHHVLVWSNHCSLSLRRTVVCVLALRAWPAAPFLLRFTTTSSKLSLSSRSHALIFQHERASFHALSLFLIGRCPSLCWQLSDVLQPSTRRGNFRRLWRIGGMPQQTSLTLANGSVIPSCFPCASVCRSRISDALRCPNVCVFPKLLGPSPEDGVFDDQNAQVDGVCELITSVSLSEETRGLSDMLPPRRTVFALILITQCFLQLNQSCGETDLSVLLSRLCQACQDHKDVRHPHLAVGVNDSSRALAELSSPLAAVEETSFPHFHFVQLQNQCVTDARPRPQQDSSPPLSCTLPTHGGTTIVPHI